MDYRKATGSITVINIFLAGTAFIKDLMFASYLGTTEEADALLTAFFIPDMVSNNLIAAAIGVTAIPVFLSILAGCGEKELWKSVKKTVAGVFLLSLLLAIIFWFIKNSIFGFLGHGFTEKTMGLCINLFILLLPTVLLYPVYRTGTSVLHTHNRFTIPAVAPLLFNLVFLLSIVGAYILKIPKRQGVYTITYFITAAVILMAVLVWNRVFHLQKKTFISAADNTITDYSSPHVLAQISRIFFPYIAILMSIQGVLYIERFLASRLGPGNISAVSYAYRLSQFPVWVFIAAIGTVSLPFMSRSHGSGETAKFKNAVTKVLMLSFVITLPVSIILFFMREPVVSILFERGEFDGRSVHMTAQVLKGYSISIIGQGITYISIRVFLAIKKVLIPLLVCAFSFALITICDFILVNTAGISGLGYGTAIGYSVNFIIFTYIICRKFNLPLKKNLRYITRIVLSSIPLTAACISVSLAWHNINSFMFRLLLAPLAVLTGLLLYFLNLRKIYAAKFK